LTRRGISGLSGSHALQLHRVPAALLRARTRHDPTPWAQVVIRLLRNALADDPWDNPPAGPLWRSLLPHILTALEPDRVLDDRLAPEAIALLRGAGGYLQSRGDPQAAGPLLERVYAFSKDRLDPDDPAMLDVVNDLADNLYDLGDFQQARTLARRHSHSPTPGHRRRSPVNARLGRQRRQRPARAGRLSPGPHPAPGHPCPPPPGPGQRPSGTLTAASNLAIDLLRLGDYQQARTLHEDILARRRRLQGEDHRDTLTAAHNLAVDLSVLGEHAQARTLNEDILVRRRRILGEDHPHTLRSAQNLARDLSALGDYQRARALLETTLNRYRQVLGNDHIYTRQSTHDLSEVLRALDDNPP
jgi:tetratricopeptide (TPR) repeat protein